MPPSPESLTDALIARRTLLKAAAAFAGGATLQALAPDAILRAASIDPAPGSTFEDAEHIVFLMQENRSFDHAYGSLQGVRGFNDPRAIDLPDGRPVWLQANSKGEVFAPFRLDMQKTNTTWNNGLPHNWPDQVDARNHGKYDRWLQVKIPGNKQVAHLPLALGHYTRADIPFYYALADAFTICDQHFCSSLTGTTPNRIHFWAGGIRAEQSPDAMPHVYNSDTDHTGKLTWTTFPERLTDAGVSWKVYQNELTVESGLTAEQDSWLANFGDNPLEYFANYRAKFLPAHHAWLQQLVEILPGDIKKLEAAVAAAPRDAAAAKKLAGARKKLAEAKADLETWKPELFDKLSDKQKALHRQAFCTNAGQPDYRQVDKFKQNNAAGTPYTFTVPKGDILHNFREDVKTGKLPTVSWLVAPQKFSDHPSAAWFGAWYVSEVLNILTQNPEVWKKTIFVLNYDENDGYFDHVPPFVPPVAGRPETGACSEGVDSSLETTTRDRESPIGLGYRVPMVVASPWSRGGWVNSEVFDLTSPIRFLETFLERKRGLKIRETNITSWRRTVVGDMTSIFRPWNGEAVPLPQFLKQQDWMTLINEAWYRPIPDPGKPLTPEDIEIAKKNPAASNRLPRQEPGTRPSCALPYDLRVDGTYNQDRKAVSISFESLARLFGKKSAGCPFQVYAPGKVAAISKAGEKKWENVRTWHYAVAAGKSLSAEWPVADFENEQYHLRVYGPNGFYRELIGSASDPAITLSAETEVGVKAAATGNLVITLKNAGATAETVQLVANAHGHAAAQKTVAPGAVETIIIPLTDTFGWYDFTLTAAGNKTFARRYAGRIETGSHSKSDPAMGAVAAR